MGCARWSDKAGSELHERHQLAIPVQLVPATCFPANTLCHCSAALSLLTWPCPHSLPCRHPTSYFSAPEEVTSVIAGLNDARDVLAPHMPGMPGYGGWAQASVQMGS